MKSNKDDSNWEFMRPFWQTLKDFEVELVHGPPRGASLRSEYEGLLLRQVSQLDTEEKLSRALEAIELVFLQLLVDKCGFLSLANECLGPTSVPLGARKPGTAPHRDAEVPPVLMLDLQQVTLRQDESLLQVLGALFRPSKLRKGHGDYVTTRDQLVGLLDESALRRVRASSGFIRCDLVLGSEQIRVDLLRSMVHLQQQREDATTSYPWYIGWTSVSLSACGIDVAGVRQLHEFVTNGSIRLRNRSMACSDKTIDPNVFATVLAALIPANSSTSLSRSTSIERSLTAEADMGTAQFAQVCSALMVTNTVDSLRLKLNGDTFEECSLMWCIHTLFSAVATHSIRHVRLPPWHYSRTRFPHRTSLDGIQEYARSANPVALLFVQSTWGEIELERAQSQRSKRVLLHRNTPLLLHPSRTSESEMPRVMSPIIVEVIHEDAEGLHVLVPRYGHCRVARSHADDERESVWRHRPLVSHTIESLTIVSVRDGMYANWQLPELLALLGRPLKSLTIKNQTGICIKDVLDQVWDNCPNLERLLMYRCNQFRIGPVVDAYATGKCKVSALGFYRVPVTEYIYGWDDATRFLEALADPSSKISTTVDELVIRHLEPSVDPQRDPIAALQRVLTHNHHLQFLDVAISDVHAKSLSSFDGELHQRRLPVEAKMAFLSVVENACSQPRGKKRTVICAASKLDRPLLANIFAMAASPVARHVQVTTEGPEFYDRAGYQGCNMIPNIRIDWSLTELEALEAATAAAVAAIPLPDEDEDL